MLQELVENARQHLYESEITLNSFQDKTELLSFKIKECTNMFLISF